MALFRCNQCNHLREVSNNYIGQAVKCPQCQAVNPIHNTVDFVTRLLDRYMAIGKELQGLRQQSGTPTASNAASADTSLHELDINNSNLLAESQQHLAIVQWFKQKGIKLDINEKSIDTSGFFDEVARNIGDNYDVLKLVVEQIRYRQRKGHTFFNLQLAKNSQKEIRQITQFCQELYKYSFVSRYNYQKDEKVVRLTLQSAQAVTEFFAGEWLEWYVFIKLLELINEKQLNASCLRNLTIHFPNEDQHELDVFFLLNGSIPVCIECKTGEFRQQIDKFVNLRKRLQLDSQQFVLCVIGLEDDQAQGLSSMYDMTFTNESNFLDHIEQLLPS